MRQTPALPGTYVKRVKNCSVSKVDERLVVLDLRRALVVLTREDSEVFLVRIVLSPRLRRLYLLLLCNGLLYLVEFALLPLLLR